MTLPDGGGCVYVVATPIGNLEDITARALRTLREVAVIACEDTRRTARLCAHFEIETPRLSLHAHNEERRVPTLLARLTRGESIALVSDAGTPLLSDPGARLVRSAIDRGHRVVPIPGPSAILAALVASGLPAHPFTFVGFPPRRGSARTAWLERLARLPGAIVIFEAPGRVARTLRDLHATLGSRRVAVARELTKRFEEVVRSRLGEIELEEPRGEVTIVVEGAPDGAEERPVWDEEAAGVLIERSRARGLGTRDTARELAAAFGLSRDEAYARVLRRARRAPGAGSRGEEPGGGGR